MHSLLVFLFLLQFASTSSAVSDTLPQSSSLSVEKPSDTLVSANGDFSAGFFQVGDNAFCFSVWFTRSKQPTIVWMANRDTPVNGKGSQLTLRKDGDLILMDAGRTTIWNSATFSPSQLQLQLKLMDSGNLVLGTLQGTTIWQSFNFPTDTLLPDQSFLQTASLVSSRSTTNYSSGFYKLYFDNDNVIRLLFNGPALSSIYWPPTWISPIDIGRSTYNITRFAVLDSFGKFTSSDGFQILSTDYGRRLYRRLKIDPDGNLRLYSFNKDRQMWEVSWQLISDTCSVHGLCGANSMCTYDHVSGRTCYCLQGYKAKDPNDWTQGCVPDFSPADLSCNNNQTDESMDFLHLANAELFGYDWNVTEVTSLKECQKICLELCDKCKGIQLQFNDDTTYNCYLKTLLLNGRDSPSFDGDFYLKLPKVTLQYSKKPLKHSPLNCATGLSPPLNPRTNSNSSTSFLVWFACGIGAFEVSTIFLVWFFLFRTKKQPDTTYQQRDLLSATRFQRFTFAELKSATKGFNEEIGRGAGGVVYKGILYDNRVAAIKRLSEATQGEEEFLAEMSTIGMLNHMNLIDMWGYCVEGKHRLLVYEYMEHGSLAHNLFCNTLDWKKRFDIAVGTARGLSYLHEECLEWVLHCDVKPQNILLDSDFQPKVADFGLSKLLNRDGHGNSAISRIRGTRGYMAPEWVYNLRITSKVDVYSYGIVVLEMVTGKSPMALHSLENSTGTEHRRLVTWVTSKINNALTTMFWIEEIIDPKLEGRYDISQIEILVKVALQCVQDDMNERPSMSQVAEMLQSHENKVSPS
ncbi:putative serine/threonine-protein kinase [Sesbania bispinosa]|nr:putative serine/threonine-protein kinase [Sesbania bispinosa]